MALLNRALSSVRARSRAPGLAVRIPSVLLADTGRKEHQRMDCAYSKAR